MEAVDESKKKITISWGLLAYIIVGVVMITSLWWRFVVVENEVDKLRNRIEYVNERHDRKNTQMEEDIDERLQPLEKPNSDGK